MDTFPPRGLSVTFSWTNAPGVRRSSHAALGPALRAAAVLGLCALSFEAGVWRQRLERSARAEAATAAVSPHPVAVVSSAPAVPAAAPAPAAAPGAPYGQSQDVITPLNVRDASALVMAPELSSPPQAEPPPVPPPQPQPKARLRSRPEISGSELRL